MWNGTHLNGSAKLAYLTNLVNGIFDGNLRIRIARKNQRLGRVIFANHPNQDTRDITRVNELSEGRARSGGLDYLGCAGLLIFYVVSKTLPWLGYLQLNMRKKRGGKKERGPFAACTLRMSAGTKCDPSPKLSYGP